MTPARRIAILLVAVLACRGSSPSAQVIDEQQLRHLVDSLMPGVAKATGLEFKLTPKSAVRTREQIHAYVIAKMDRELPASRIEGIAATYRLLDLLPDSIDIRKLFLDLYTEQIAGFYDPDSTTLFAVQGTDSGPLRLVLAHELVHALQHQYIPLDSILHDATDADRQSAAQAVLEGQATLASIVAMAPGIDILNNDAVMATLREGLRMQQAGTGVYATAPMVIREGLTFPYVEGGEFMRWFDKNHPDKVPFGSAMPQSTEQILHPDRYASGDVPLRMRFTGDTAGMIFDDTFGEFDIHLLRTQLTHAPSVRTPVIGWGGDRLRIFRTSAGPALVWVIVWDDVASEGQFRTQVADSLVRHPRPGYRVAVEALAVGGKPGTRVVVAPTGWARWKSLPGAKIQ